MCFFLSFSRFTLPYFGWLAGFGKSMTIEIEVSAFTILYGGIIRSMYLQGK